MGRQCFRNTPFEPSKFPGADTIRMATAAHFTLKTDPDCPADFTAFNVHLDDLSDDARRLAASLMLTRARYEVYNTGRPVILTGDFNMVETLEDRWEGKGLTVSGGGEKDQWTSLKTGFDLTDLG